MMAAWVGRSAVGMIWPNSGLTTIPWDTSTVVMLSGRLKLWCPVPQIVPIPCCSGFAVVYVLIVFVPIY